EKKGAPGRRALEGECRALSLREQGHRLGRIGRAWWQYRIGYFRNIAGQGLEEGDDGFHFVVVQLGAQLGSTHYRNGFFQAPDGGGVEIGRGQLDVTQRRGAEHILVRRGFGDGEAAFVALWQDLGTGLVNQPEWIVVLAAEVHTAVAGGTAAVHEQCQAFFLT